MISLKAFGALELRGDDGSALHSVLAQPKRQALLAYLAIATPRGFHRRDALLPLFWPELDEAHARAALSRAVHYLRQSLGSDVVLSRGHDELGLDWSRLWCDAAGFESALDRGDLEEALAIYHGDLLPGFFVEDAPEFGEWLDRERERLRQRAVCAARQLAEREQAAGRLEQAVLRARQAVDLSPWDEPAARALMVLLDDSGDRAGAVRAYEELTQRLQRDLDVEPAPESQVLAADIRTRDAVRVVEPQSAEIRTRDAVRVVERQPGSHAPTPAFVPSAHATPSAHAPPSVSATPAAPVIVAPQAAVARSRRTYRFGVPAVAALAVVLVAALTMPRAMNRSGGDSVSSVALLPFDVIATTADDFPDRKLLERLAEEIDRAGVLRTVDASTMRRVLGDTDRVGNADAARALARRAGATYALFGTVETVAGVMRVRLALVDTAAGTAPAAIAALEGTTDQLDALAADLAFQLNIVQPGSGRPVLPEFPRHIAPGALEHHAAGDAHRDAGRFAEAYAEYRSAVDADSTFAIAYYQLSRVANWKGEWEIAAWALNGAVRHSGTLALLDQFRIEAWQAFQTGRPEDAERLVRTILAYRGDPDAWFTLGEVLFHWGAQLGWTLAQARSAFEHAAERQPGNVDALLHRARLAALDDPALLARFGAQSRGMPLDEEQSLEMRGLHAFTQGTDAERAAVVRAAANLDDRRLFSLVNWITVYATMPARTRLAAVMRAPGRGAQYRALGALYDAHIAMSDGRAADAFAALDAAPELTAGRRAEYRAVYGTLPFVSLSHTELRALRDGLAAQTPVEIGPDIHALGGTGVFPPRHAYLLALLSVRLDDAHAVTQYMEHIDQAGRTPHSDAGHYRMMARILNAERLHARGEYERALDVLGAPALLPSRTLTGVVDYAQAHERFLRAELLRALGRDREALRWYETFPEPGGSDLPWVGPSLLRRAELQERLGMDMAARASRERAAARWVQADASVRAWNGPPAPNPGFTSLHDDRQQAAAEIGVPTMHQLELNRGLAGGLAGEVAVVAMIGVADDRVVRDDHAEALTLILVREERASEVGRCVGVEEPDLDLEHFRHGQVQRLGECCVRADGHGQHVTGEGVEDDHTAGLGMIIRLDGVVAGRAQHERGGGQRQAEGTGHVITHGQLP